MFACLHKWVSGSPTKYIPFIFSLSAFLLKKKCNYKKCNWVSGSPSILYAKKYFIDNYETACNNRECYICRLDIRDVFQNWNEKNVNIRRMLMVGRAGAGPCVWGLGRGRQASAVSGGGPIAGPLRPVGRRRWELPGGLLAWLSVCNDRK